MIIRHIPMKMARLSNFVTLAKYITNEQNKQERVGTVRITNCNSIEPTWAIHEVMATQAKNQRATGDKNYHMLISFAPGENPPEEVIKIIEDRVVTAIGLKDHQRISVVHHDTDNLHIHVAINKIHPVSFNMIEPYRAYKVFAEVASKLEVEFGLKITNHLPTLSRSENLANDMERHSGIESLINWMKRHCIASIESANSWLEVHHLLAQHGLAMRIKGNGLVFCDKRGLTIKASSVSRSFSKKNMETKLGRFKSYKLNGDLTQEKIYQYEPLNKKAIGSELYVQYQHEKHNSKTILSEKLKRLRLSKKRLIEQAKKRGRIKRMAVKLMKSSRTSKKLLYKQISKTLLAEIEKIQKNHSKERDHLTETYKRRTWADWLKKIAEEGHSDALNALRYRNRKNGNQYSFSGEVRDISLSEIEKVDSVTKEGTAIYKFDKTTVRNEGTEVKILRGSSIDALKHAIEMAKKQYGDCIQVNGTELFKQVVIKTTVKYQIPVTFNCPKMEKERQKLILMQESNNERSRTLRHNDGRRASESNGTVRRRKIRGKLSGLRELLSFRRKPDACSLRQGPPAESENSLRNLSQLDVVQLSRGSEVLLPGDAHYQLERKGVKPDNHVRRKLFGLMKKNNKQ